jgi:hypothetical protein
MQKFTWLDADDETLFEAELNALEEDQEFLEHYYGVTMLLDAVEGAEELEFEDESLAS